MPRLYRRSRGQNGAPAFDKAAAASTGGVDFVPTDIPSIAAWFKFGSGITVAGAGVSQWDDQSGYGRHLKQATDTNRPALQSDGSILFDGVDNFMQTDAFTLNSPVTFCALMKQVTWTVNDRHFDGRTGNTGALNSITAEPIVAIRAATGSAAANSNLAVDTYAAVVLVQNGAASILRINNTTETTGDPGVGNPGGICLGAVGGGASNWGNAQFKEFCAFSSALDLSDRLKIVRYLSSVGGLGL